MWLERLRKLKKKIIHLIGVKDTQWLWHYATNQMVLGSRPSGF
jgi:hypothetical protein